MCEAVLERYASEINAVDDDNVDVIPSILLFSGKDCAGSMWPNNGGADFPTTNPFANGSTTAVPLDSQAVGSILIPFPFHTVKFSDNVTTLPISGPFTILDMADVGLTTVKTIEIVDSSDWNSVVLPSACGGTLKRIGKYGLTRYQPQTSRCDAFMTNLCNTATNPAANPLCGCFVDETDLENRVQTLGVNLPVTCFGPRCAGDSVAYRTAVMAAEACNLTICQQTIQASPGVIQDGEFTIYCGGQYYQRNGQVITPPAASSQTGTTANAASATTSSASQWISYAVLGAGMFICLILVFLIFSPKARIGNDPVLQQIQSLVRSKPKTEDLTPQDPFAIDP